MKKQSVSTLLLLLFLGFSCSGPKVKENNESYTARDSKTFLNSVPQINFQLLLEVMISAGILRIILKVILIGRTILQETLLMMLPIIREMIALNLKFYLLPWRHPNAGGNGNNTCHLIKVGKSGQT